MCDEFLIDFIKIFEEELKFILVEFFYQMTNKVVNCIDQNTSAMEILKFIQDYNLNGNVYLEKVSLILQEKLIQQNLNLFELNLLIDLIRFFTSINLQLNDKNSFQLHLFDNVCGELKSFKNFIFSENKLDDELMQRFFENIHFFCKFINFPKYQKNVLSDNFCKELNLAIKCAMQINLQRENSFLNKYQIKSDKNLLEDNFNIIKENLNNGQTNFNQERYQYASRQFLKEKLVNFNFENFKDKIEIDLPEKNVRHLDKNNIIKKTIINYSELKKQEEKQKQENQFILSINEEDSKIKIDENDSNANFRFGEQSNTIIENTFEEENYDNIHFKKV